jgi:dihydroxyacid dehydratase/phosphogluconate dehydratase
VLHVAPEAAALGPLAKLRTGDPVTLDVAARRIDADVPDLDAREPAPAMVAALASPRRGWERLYVDTVQGADTGADLDFLTGSSGSRVARDSH